MHYENIAIRSPSELDGIYCLFLLNSDSRPIADSYHLFPLLVGNMLSSSSAEEMSLDENDNLISHSRRTHMSSSPFEGDLQKEAHIKDICISREEVLKNEEEEEEEENAKMQYQMSQQLNKETYLIIMSTIRYFSNIYKYELWEFNPINPLCLKYDSLSYLFTTREGAEERSSLSLSSHAALASGKVFLLHSTLKKKNERKKFLRLWN